MIAITHRSLLLSKRYKGKFRYSKHITDNTPLYALLLEILQENDTSEDAN